MGLQEAKANAGLDFKSKPSVSKPKIMDFRPSSGLATGLKRIGGRGGTSRLGKANRENISKARKGQPLISHKY